MSRIFNFVSLFVLGPLLFYPFTFCPFRLPYLYCFICPARCGWGRFRGVILVAAVGLNLRKDLFCGRLCPFGSLQRILFKLKGRKFTLPGFISRFRYIVLALLALVVILTLRPQWVFSGITGGMRNIFLIILLSGLIGGIFVYRMFCYNFCPVKLINDLLAKFGLRSSRK